MAAHWHIMLPYELIVEDKPEMDLAYEEQYKEHFIFERTNEYQKVLAMPIGVPQMAFHYREKQYQLSKTVLREEFLAFYRFFLNEFSKLYNTEKPKFYSHVFETDVLSDFLRNMEDLNCNGFEMRCIETIERIPTNYFLHFETLHPGLVYEGYPLPLHYHSEIKAVCLLHSYEKMNLVAQETVAFHNFVNHIQEVAKDKFKLAKYLFTAGF